MLRKIKRNIARNRMRKAGMDQLHKCKRFKNNMRGSSKFAREWKAYL